MARTPFFIASYYCCDNAGTAVQVPKAGKGGMVAHDLSRPSFAAETAPRRQKTGSHPRIKSEGELFGIMR